MRKAIRAVGAFLGLAALFTGNNTTTQQHKTTVKHDIINQRPSAPRIRTERKMSTGADNPYRYHFTPKGNQRQYRKWLRQNPSMRKSKKNKLRK